MNYKIYFRIANIVMLWLIFVVTVLAQTTEFTYQGRLNDNSVAANSNYDFEFRLYDAAAGGTLLGTQPRSGVAVANGVFTVRLDFGTQFTGAARFLEISVKPAGSASPFTTLAPRQPVTSTPYAIRSLNSGTADTATNSTQLGGVAANQFVQTNDARLTDSRNPLPGSAGYIQNRTTQQTAANFNISGSGTAGGTLSGNAVNTATQYNIGGARILTSAGINDTIVGIQAGEANPTGIANSFFGQQAGRNTTTGTRNSFFGQRAGVANIGGSDNAIFGQNAGSANTNGNQNSFFGSNAGASNVTGNDNSFFGRYAGFSNTTGGSNTFAGQYSGQANTNGIGNSFFGNSAGASNIGGDANTFVGFFAGKANTVGNSNVFVGNDTGADNTTGSNNTLLGTLANVGSGNLSYATAIGAGAEVTTNNTIVLGRPSDLVIIRGDLRLHGLGTAGGTALCRNASFEISNCSSSLRYKNNVKPFSFGLNLVNQLKPISFNWKDGGMADLGLGAEDVAAIEPLLINYNDKGEVEGVKYDRIGVVLLNAFKEQQTQIETQQKQTNEQNQIIKQQTKKINQQETRFYKQQTEIEVLKGLVCSQNPAAHLCQPKSEAPKR